MESLCLDYDHEVLSLAFLVDLDFGQILQDAKLGRSSIEVFAHDSALKSRVVSNY